MIKKIEQAENTDIPDFQPLRIVDLESKIGRRVLLVAVVRLMDGLSEVGNNRCFSYYF